MANRRVRKKTGSKSEMSVQEIGSVRESNITSTMPPLNLTFFAKTNDAFHFKVTAGLLCDNIKIGCFKLSSSGIGLKGMNTSESLLIKIFMKSSSFNRYEYTNPLPKVIIGLNIPHFNRMLKSIKKKDTLQLNVDGDSELKIKTSPLNNSRVTTSILKIQRVQQVRIANPPDTYGNPVTVSSSEFNKMIKDLNSINPIIRIYFSTGYIKFECGDGNVLRRTIEFGDTDVQTNRELNMQEYDTEQLFRICKISGMNNQMQLYTGVDMPLHIKSMIGNTGDASISLYIKNNQMMTASSTMS
jgi:hypothetical protein